MAQTYLAIVEEINQSLFFRGFFEVVDAKSGQEPFPTKLAGAELPTSIIASYFSLNDRWLAVSLKGSLIRLFDLEKDRIKELRGRSNEVPFMSLSVDGRLLASASLDRTVRLWHLPSGAPVGFPLEHRWPVIRAILSEDGRWLTSASFANPLGGGEGEVQAWKVSTGERLGSPIKTRDFISMFVAPGE